MYIYILFIFCRMKYLTGFYNKKQNIIVKLEKKSYDENFAWVLSYSYFELEHKLISFTALL